MTVWIVENDVEKKIFSKESNIKYRNLIERQQKIRNQNSLNFFCVLTFSQFKTWMMMIMKHTLFRFYFDFYFLVWSFLVVTRNAPSLLHRIFLFRSTHTHTYYIGKMKFVVCYLPDPKEQKKMLHCSRIRIIIIRINVWKFMAYR